MATALSLTPTGGIPRRSRPSQAHLPRPGSPFLSPSFFSVHHSTSALRSTSPNILVGSAGASSALVSHDLEINPWEVALANHHAQVGGESSAAQNSEIADVEVGRKGLSPRSTWERQARLGKRGLPSPALVVVHDGGVESVEERRLKRARVEDEAGGEGRSDRSRRLSTASRLAYLSPPPLEPTTSTDSSSSADSLPLAESALPSRSSPKKTKPLSASPSFAIPSIPIAPSPGTSELFPRVHVEHESRPAPSELRIQAYDIAPRPIDLVPSPRSETHPTPAFYTTAPISFSPNTESAPSSIVIPEMKAEVKSCSAPSPNLPPRPQSIFLPPLSCTPTLTPSANALKAARTPPAPLASSATESKVVAPPVDVKKATSTPTEPSEKGNAAKREKQQVEKGKGKAKEPPVLDALERNRIAAQKCRAKKKEKVQGLAEREQILSQANVSLHDEVSSLQADLASLCSEVEQRHPLGDCTCAEVQWWRAQTEAHDAVKAEEAHWAAEGKEVRGQLETEEELDELEDDVEAQESRKQGEKSGEREADQADGPARPARKRAKR